MQRQHARQLAEQGGWIDDRKAAPVNNGAERIGGQVPEHLSPSRRAGWPAHADVNSLVGLGPWQRKGPQPGRRQVAEECSRRQHDTQRQASVTKVALVGC
jgi:hypothetical protein